MYGAISPVSGLTGAQMTGGPNEIWSYGEEVFTILKDLVFLRERLRPYITTQMHFAHTEGLPLMRPLLLEFPSDPESWEIDDEFMFGPDLLVAPITRLGARSRDVYLPEGPTWVDVWTGEQLNGRVTISVPAPLRQIPLFLRDGAELPIRT